MRTPTAFAKFSSKVTLKMRLYKSTKSSITITETTAQIVTSVLPSIKIDVEPNKVLHTSPATFDAVEKTFKSRYPIDKAPTESIAIIESPLSLVLCPVRRSKIAQTAVTGKTMSILFVTLSIVAIATAPNATCDSPSPIKENRFSTKTVPKSDEHSEINTPVMSA